MDSCGQPSTVSSQLTEELFEQQYGLFTTLALICVTQELLRMAKMSVNINPFMTVKSPG